MKDDDLKKEVCDLIDDITNLCSGSSQKVVISALMNTVAIAIAELPDSQEIAKVIGGALPMVVKHWQKDQMEPE